MAVGSVPNQSSQNYLWHKRIFILILWISLITLKVVVLLESSLVALAIFSLAAVRGVNVNDAAQDAVAVQINLKSDRQSRGGSSRSPEEDKTPDSALVSSQCRSCLQSLSTAHCPFDSR